MIFEETLRPIVRELRGGALNAALTGRVIRDRVLGESRDATVTLRATFYAAGNNVQVTGDTSRRVIYVRLESKDEHPEERADFKHADLRAYVLAERSRLVCAALTILRAYYVVGRPADKPPLGSFEVWSRALRDQLIGVGAEDPCKTRPALLEADSEEVLLRQILSGWRDVADASARRLLAVTRLQRSPGLREAFEEMGAATSENIDGVSVGHRLAQYQGCWRGAMRLVKGRPGRTGVTPWRVESCGSEHPSITGAAAP